MHVYVQVRCACAYVGATVYVVHVDDQRCDVVELCVVIWCMGYVRCAVLCEVMYGVPVVMGYVCVCDDDDDQFVRR